MKEPRTIEGQWWIAGDAGEPAQGTLKCDPEDGLSLSIHIFRSSDVATLPMFDLGKLTCPQTIHGLDEHGHPVTVFGCSIGNTTATTAARYVTITAIAAFAGAGMTSWGEQKFCAVKLEFSLLHNWMNRHRLKERNPAKPLSFELAMPDDLIMTLTDGVKVRISAGFAMNTSLREESLFFSHVVYLHFPQLESPESITSKWTMTIQHLLTLLTGERIFLDDCTFFDYDPFESGLTKQRTSASLLRSCRGIKSANRDQSGHHMVTQYKDLGDQLETIVTKWFALDERLKPVVDLFMLVRSQSAPTIELRFLVLAQALEAFHSRSDSFVGTDMSRANHRTRVEALTACVPPEHQDWLREKLAHANQKTLAARLADILAQHPAEVAILTARIPDFATKVKNTRNYFTHYGAELLEKGKVAEGDELIRITFALEALLGVCLLKETGVHGQPLERFVNRYSKLEFIQLTETVSEPAPQTVEPTPLLDAAAQPSTPNSQPS